MTKAPPKPKRSAKAAREPLPKASGVLPWIGTVKQPGRLRNVLRVLEESYSADPNAGSALEKLELLLTDPLAIGAWSKIDAIARKIGSPGAGLAHKVFVAAAHALLGDVDLANPPEPALREREIAALLRRIVGGGGTAVDESFTEWEREVLFPEFVEAANRVASHFEATAETESPLKVVAASRPNRDTNQRMMFIRVVGATMKKQLGKAPISALVTLTNTVFKDQQVSEQIVRRLLSEQ